MKDEDLKSWCYEIWPKHWRDLAPSSNSRALFVKEMKKLSPDEEELKRIEGSILAQTRFWRIKSKREKVFGIPRLSQWIKDCRFDDAFIDESYMDIQPKEVGKCQCGKDVIGEKFSVCHDCLKTDLHRNTKVRVMTEKGLLPDSGESKSQYAARCRDSLPSQWRKFISGQR